MKIYFDNYERPEPAKLYLGTPSNKVLCALNGVVADTASLTRNLNNNYELTFDVDRYILGEDGEQIESNGYDWLEVKMRVYLDTMGWFICDSPTVHNDGIREYKTITAYSCEIEMLQHDLINLKINCGTTDSYEMLIEGNVDIIDEVEFAKEFITFYNRERPELSFLDIVLKESGIRGWKIGHVDDIPYEYRYYENGEFKTKYVSLSLEKGTFDIESQDLYSFLTQDAAQHFNCIFLFDFKHMIIDVWRPNNLGKNTNVNIGFRNLQNSNSISVSENDLFTRYMVYGSDGLGVEFVNFGWQRIENLEYFLNEKYLSKELIAKYRLWQADVEYYRPQFVEYSRLYNAQLEVVSELTNRVPLDDCSTNWATFEDEELLEAKKNYEAQLKGYESYYVDENNNFDKEALDNSVDANDYYQIKDVILPSIEIEMRNRKLNDEDDYEEYIKTYETDWDLYGLDELKVKIETYENTVEVCESKHYDMPYEDYKALSDADSEKYSSHTESYHNKMYEKYQEAEHQLNERYSDSCAYALKVRQKEVDEANALLESYDDERDKIITYVEKETWNHRTSTSTASVDTDGTLSVSEQNLEVVNGVLTADFAPYVDGDGVLSFDHEFYFTEQDLSDLSKLYIDGEYTNEYMFLVGSDTTVTAIDEQLKLLDAATEDLYIASQPQYIYTSDAENFLAQVEYKNYVENLELGDFIWLGVRDDEVVKLRLIAMTYNPMVMDGQLEIEFSNMIKSRASRDDFSFLLGSATSRGKNSSSRSGNNYVSNGEVALTSGLINKLLQNGAFQNGLNEIIGDSIDGIIEGNDAFFEYLQAELISADSVVANSGSFGELEALVAQIDSLLAGNVSAELGHLIHITAENAVFDEAVILDLLAGNIAAGTINTDKLSLSSEDGSFTIVGNTMQFKDENGVVRIQIGKDANNNFTFVLYDEKGEGVLLDSTGIHKSAITDGLLETKMYADKSVTVTKIDETGIYEWEDDSGNKVMNIKNMYYGDDKFDVSYSTLTENVTKTIQDVEDLKTSLGTLELVGEQIFKESNDTISPDSITLTAVCRNGATVGKWYIDEVENTEYVSEDLLTITIPSTYMANKETITVRVVDFSEKLYDETTLYHLKDAEGIQGEAAYTVILQNENISFVVDYDTNECTDNNSYSCGITIYKGIEERTDYTIGNIAYSDNSDGIIAENLVDTIVITATKGTEISAQSGAITVPILIDGITFYKDITWNRVTTGKPGEDGTGLSILGSYKTEEELNTAHPTGKPGEGYIVNGYLFVWNEENQKWENVGKIQGDPALNIVLSNESQNIPCTNEGIVSENMLITINYDGYKGLDKVASSAAILTTPLPDGITLGQNDPSTSDVSGSIVFNIVEGATLDNVLTGDINIQFTIEEQTINKTFKWTKSLAGENGVAILYNLEASDPVLAKDYDGVINPTQITFYSYLKDDTLDAPQLYAGRFIVQENVDNTGYTNVLVSTENASSITYAVSSNNVVGIKCFLYESDGITKELDRITVPVLSNVDGIKGEITQITNTVSDVSTKVDAANKAITDEVWRNTIIDVVDENGETTSKTLESYIATHQVDLEGVKTEVSDVKTEFGEDINTLQTNVSTLTQDAEGFKAEVTANYVTTSKLKEELNEKNKTFQSTPTPPYLTGDLWIKETEDGEKELYQCVQGKAEGEEFAESDWVKATDYQTTSQVSSAITQKADEINAHIENTDGQVSDLTLRVDGLESTVTDPETGLQTKVEQNSDKISLVVSENGVMSEDGTINAGNIVTSINADSDGVLIKAERIELTSVVDDVTTKVIADGGFLTQVDKDELHTEIEQTEENLTLEIGKKKDNIPSIRYIRDWLWGTQDNENKNRWVKCLAYQEDINRTNGDNVTLGILDENELLDKSYDLSVYIDETIEFDYSDSSTYIDLNPDADDTSQMKQAIQVDLGQTYPITSLYIEHYSGLVSEIVNEGTEEETEVAVIVDRIFNHRLEVSNDGITWFTLYDSDASGGYIENGDGRTYYPSDYATYKAISSLSVDLDGITARVQDTEEKYAELKIESDNITSTVSGTMNEDGTRNEDGLVHKVSTITHDATRWEANFAVVGLSSTDASTFEATAIDMSIDGIKVSQKSQNEDGEYIKDGRSVVIDVEGFHGYSADGKEIFTFEDDLTITERILVNNGVDFGQSMKYINRDYTYISSSTEKTVTVPCLVHVVTGGSS